MDCNVGCPFFRQEKCWPLHVTEKVSLAIHTPCRDSREISFLVSFYRLYIYLHSPPNIGLEGFSEVVGVQSSLPIWKGKTIYGKVWLWYVCCNRFKYIIYFSFSKYSKNTVRSLLAPYQFQLCLVYYQRNFMRVSGPHAHFLTILDSPFLFVNFEKLVTSHLSPCHRIVVPHDTIRWNFIPRKKVFVHQNRHRSETGDSTKPRWSPGRSHRFKTSAITAWKLPIRRASC